VTRKVCSAFLCVSSQRRVSVEIHAVVMVVEIAVVEKTVVVETEEDINIPFYNYKKRCQCKLTPFIWYIPVRNTYYEAV
jgi:hypothetical protein